MRLEQLLNGGERVNIPDFRRALKAEGMASARALKQEHRKEARVGRVSEKERRGRELGDKEGGKATVQRPGSHSKDLASTQTEIGSSA